MGNSESKSQTTVADNIKKQGKKSETVDAPKQQTQPVPRSGAFNPGLIISKGVASKPSSLPVVEQLGNISLEELNKYNCDNEDRRMLSLFGTVFDVTSAVTKYGKEGAYRDFAGHDITLCLGSGKLETKWLDRFVLMSDKHIEASQGWVEFYETQYPKAGTLNKWDEDQSKWPKPTEQEMEELNADCLIM
eukprot:CAMPEP_0202695804 /NCGR_PEP_ID=MMETSP1385-20130828/9291_1 /ASSEMBLY_ACC=CAM_ASM_000861 /TAXON_ID=933848 /ORGANISM="Elphidium margaritaceum" /LENGTH=189 /DNA_ID=CAMNT_0049351881 /DNA_START=128 /DNA_END=697 /DNA_ORIENTATION=+